MFLAFCPGPDATVVMMAGLLLLLGLAALCASAVFALIIFVRWADARRRRLAAEYSLTGDAGRS